MDLHLLAYNNYYNRLVKREETLADYRAYEISGPLMNIEFNPNDGVNTTQIINWDAVTMPDYLVVSESGDIISRWFVMEATRLRFGQYRLMLRRDLIADFYNDVLSAPAFIEKATVPANDIFIYNREDMTFNQVKESETLLKDETGSAWIVGYYDRKDRVDRYVTYESGGVYRVYETLTDCPIIGKRQANKSGQYVYARKLAENSEIKMLFSYPGISFPSDGAPVAAPDDKQLLYITNPIISDPSAFIVAKGAEDIPRAVNTNVYALPLNEDIVTDIRDEIAGAVWNNIYDSMRTLAGVDDVEQVADITMDTYLDKTIYVKDIGKYYRITSSTTIDSTPYKERPLPSEPGVTEKTEVQEIPVFLPGAGLITQQVGVVTPGAPAEKTPLYNIRQQVESVLKQFPAYFKFYNSGVYPSGLSVSDEYIYLTLNVRESTFVLQDVTNQFTTKLKISNERRKASDAPYDIFCIPYSDSYEFKIGTTTYTNNQSAALEAAFGVAEELGGESAKYLIDLQLLPYCPVRDLIDTNTGQLSLSNSDYGIKFDTIIKNSSIKSVICWADSARLDFSIHLSLPVASGSEKKIQNETEKTRICSPNYNGNFEFSVAKNNGVDYFRIKADYKPFSPFIHVAPNFKYLYGQEYGDARGLTCGGDFSLPIVTDAWETYQLANKNYDAMFNREIESLEVSQRYERITQSANIIAGALSGGASGAITGAIAGGGVAGAIAGGAVGVAGSIGAGVIDYKMSEMLRSEALDYKVDMYGYALGNIQALPRSVAKVSTIDPNNKLFPFIEMYSATLYEKQALRNKIKYNGMTVMRVGTVGEFLPNQENQYIKAKLIRLKNISDDTHLINALSEEVNKGGFYNVNTATL